MYLLEPQLKDGPGGLRDIHTAMWLAKVKYKVKDIRELVVKGVISDRERLDVEASQDFLFRVRNALHFLTGAHQDQLTFEFQDRIATELGFGDHDTGRPWSTFMKTYYVHATTVRRFSDTVIERCTERPHPYRLIGRVVGREIRDGVLDPQPHDLGERRRGAAARADESGHVVPRRPTSRRRRSPRARSG